MPAALAFACFPLLWFLLVPRVRSWRVAFLLAAVGCATYAVAVIEILSPAGMVTRVALSLAWGMPLGALIALVLRVPSPLKPIAHAWRWWRREPIAILLTVYLAALLVVAFVAPPNTWDAMTYHMSRVAHWAQNGSVATYATHNARQIHMAPGSEFLILHAQVLTGSDRLANTVQWSALVGCIVGVSVIARILGAGPRGQLFAAALCGSLPMAILQATSAQNDLVAALWIVCFIALGLELRHATIPWLMTIGAGLSFGLAVLTKTTTLLVLPAFSLLIFLALPMTLWRRVRYAAAVMLLGAAVNAGYFARNVRASGSPLGPGVEQADGVTYAYTNDASTPATLVSNVMRNVALQLALPSWSWNKAVDEFVRTTHLLMDIDPHDPRTTVHGHRFHLSDAGDREDQAQGVIVIFISVAAIIALLARDQPQRRLRLAYFGCVIVSFLLFCAALKWQPWHTRLHLPMLVLLTAAAAPFLEGHVPRLAQTPLLLLVLLASLPSVLRNPSRPMLGKYSIFRVPRVVQYFNNRTDLLAPYTAAADEVAQSGCDRIGLVIPHDGWEYPLWVLLNARRPVVTIEHVEVKNYTAPYGGQAEPCGTLRIGREGVRWITGPPPASRPGSG